ncbi:MAG: pyridoxamine 5'-phosphate oxidase family protein [bacterium]|nr:pyridoxamine 5'-phosphate oxidase family protein [bacterium]
MQITDQNWPALKKVMRDGGMSSMYYSFATVGEDGSPHVSPIGSLILGDTGKAFYCEEYPSLMARNLNANQKICIMAVNSGKWFWLRSLARGKFSRPSGVRLIGRVGEKRRITEEEALAWLKIVKPLRMFKGHDILWKNLSHVRDVRFDSYEPIRTGVMDCKID